MYAYILLSKGIQMFAPAATKPSFPFLDGVAHFFSTLAAVFSGAQQARRVYERLSRLSDAQLAARGLTRDDIARLALEAMAGGGR